jgi:hypothetical protein
MVVRRYLAALLLIPVVAACATSAAELRAQARQDYAVPAETTDLALQQDLDRCNTKAADAGRGLLIASTATMPIGLLFWPLLPVSIGLGAAAAGKAESAKNQCMSGAGYLKGGTTPTPPLAPAPIEQTFANAWWDHAEPTAQPWLGLGK